MTKPTDTARILFSLYADDQNMEQGCHANQDQLSAYVDDELNHLPVATLYPILDAQLMTCPSCKVVYEELKALLSLVHTDNLAFPPVSASFDFGYLPQPDAAALPKVNGIRAESVVNFVTWRLTDVGRLIVTFSDEFIHSLHSGAQQPAFLKTTGDDLFAITSPDIADDLSVTIKARAKRRDTERCTLNVHVDIPSRKGWPNLDGTVVTLTFAGHPLKTQTTDVFGNANFDDVARTDLAQLTVMVEPS
jgi:anti-sigma factor RsiW